MNLSKTKTFSITQTIDTGEVVTGTFTTKRLSIKDRSRIGVRKSQLSSGMYCVRDEDGKPTGQGLDEDTDYLNAMIAHLEVSLEQRPKWFDLDQIEDVDLIQSVYGEVMDWETSFFRTKNGSKDDGSGQVGEGDSSTQPDQTNATSNPTQVVGSEVQTALDA